MKVREISEAERQEVEDYLSLAEDLLYSLIPPFLPEYEYIQFAPPGQIEAGKKKFEELRQQLWEKVCQEWNLCKKIDDPALQDPINLVVTVADLISAVTIHIPPFLISSILVKIGLRNYCNCSHE